MIKQILIMSVLSIVLIACSGGNEGKMIYDGRMDTDIVRLSAQVAGIIDSLAVDEGDAISKKMVLAKINTDRLETQLKLQKAQLTELEGNIVSLNAQINQVDAELGLAELTLAKTEKMLKDGAATTQQRDELQTKVVVLRARKNSIKSNYKIINSKREQLNASIELTQINLNDATIRSPLEGVVINKIKNVGELINPGMVLLEVADLSMLEATIYVPLVKLDQVKIGQDVDLFIDASDEVFPGKVKWISSKSEFTPKTVLTEETRETLVYAVKVDVNNPDGKLKIGMPVEVKIN